MDYPKLLGEPRAVEARLAQINEEHMASLTTFIHRLRKSMGPEAAIPYIDPWDGGVEAEALFLLEAPGAKSKNSGFVSMNNPDETAKNFFEACQQTRLERKRIVIWNTVPWYIGTGTRIRPANAVDIAAGIESLADLLQLLPNLRMIILVGGKAQKAERHIRELAPHLEMLASPHPSPMFVNRRPENREALLSRWRAIQTFLES